VLTVSSNPFEREFEFIKNKETRFE